MKAFFLLILLSFLLSACKSTEPSQSELHLESENSHLRIQFENIEIGEWENQPGFFLSVSATSLLSEYDASDDYRYTMDSILIDENGQTYEATYKETAPADNDSAEEEQVIIRQFFTPPISTEIEQLNVKVYTKPLYYQREVVFSNVQDGMINLINNDLILEKVIIDDRKLEIQVADIHEIKGLELSLIEKNEEIYPVFTTTDYNDETHRLLATYEFAKPLSDSLTLKLTRLRLQEQIWEYPLTIPINETADSN